MEHVDVRLGLPAAGLRHGGVGRGGTRTADDEQGTHSDEGAGGEEATYGSAGHRREDIGSAPRVEDWCHPSTPTTHLGH
ncbi:hypothetical protein NSI01_09480 [Pimelobacter simplex]|nr:hypothetical protein NSI01_09480 [Pimelobacter simplex]